MIHSIISKYEMNQNYKVYHFQIQNELKYKVYILYSKLPKKTPTCECMTSGVIAFLFRLTFSRLGDLDPCLTCERSVAGMGAPLLQLFVMGEFCLDWFCVGVGGS